MNRAQMAVIFSLLCCSVALAQSIPYQPQQSLGISHRSAENFYYWKNNPPFPGYWKMNVAADVDGLRVGVNLNSSDCKNFLLPAI